LYTSITFLRWQKRNSAYSTGRCRSQTANRRLRIIGNPNIACFWRPHHFAVRAQGQTTETTFEPFECSATSSP
jgi:hypothetical protein